MNAEALAELIRDPELPLETVAVATGLPLAYLAGWHDGYHADDGGWVLVPENAAAREITDYATGRREGRDYWHEITGGRLPDRQPAA